jgi:hypothetical protein
MEQAELDKWNRHIGMPAEFDFDGDKFSFVPLSMEDIGELLSVGGEFSKGLQTPEAISRASALAYKMVKASYPELSEDTLKAFVAKNLPRLISILFELNNFESKANKIVDKIRKAKGDTGAVPEGQ